MPLVLAAQGFAERADAAEPRAGRVVDDGALDRADADILEVHDLALVLEKGEHAAEDLPHQFRREVVEGKPADDRVVRTAELRFLDRRAMQAHLDAGMALAVLRQHVLFEQAAELLVDLDEVEVVARAQLSQDRARERSRAGTDLEDPTRSLHPADRLGHRPRQDRRRRPDRSRAAEIGQCLGEEIKHGA